MGAIVTGNAALPWRRAAAGWGAAILLYAAVAVFVLGDGADLRRDLLGNGGDPQIFVWALAWWPWAVRHGLDPLYTHLVWQPLGVPLLWVTSVPLLSLLAAPLTLLGGPALAYNVLVLAAPVLAALAAFGLCRYVAGGFWPALLGGYLYGFSAYEMAADLATLNLSFTCLLPCLVLLALARLDGRIGRGGAVALVSLLMVLQFLISIEVFATAVLCGGIAWLLALRMLPARRKALLGLLLDALWAAPIVLLVLSPLLLAMLRDAHYVLLPPAWKWIFTADLLNVFVPTRLTALGGQLGLPVSHRFAGDLQEQDAYLGLPLLLIFLWFGIARWRERGAALLLVLLGVFLLLSLGPRLWVDGVQTAIFLPWALLMQLPLIGAALPARFALYVSLAGALIAALWMAGGRGWWRPGLGLLACLALLPAPHPWTALPHTVFFQPGRVQAALGPTPRLLVLPFGSRGPSTFWQVRSDFGYAQTGGYLGYPPRAMQHYNVVEQLFDDFQLPGFGADLTLFCQSTGTQYVVAGPGVSPGLAAALAALHWTARRIDDVTVLTVPPR